MISLLSISSKLSNLWGQMVYTHIILAIKLWSDRGRWYPSMLDTYGKSTFYTKVRRILSVLCCLGNFWYLPLLLFVLKIFIEFVRNEIYRKLNFFLYKYLNYNCNNNWVNSIIYYDCNNFLLYSLQEEFLNTACNINLKPYYLVYLNHNHCHCKI